MIENMMISSVIKGIAEVTKKILGNHLGETAYSECEIQEGYVDYLKIHFQKQKISFFISDFKWDNSSKKTILKPNPTYPKI